ncbi:flagellin [Bacillus sp. YC2]|uniref:flagellin N-terminal helical domain-containing protein n=1 Tax=Bacillus sp. YC2 TaxID=2861287 RepID=UPI001CA60EEA|nr:flagellin [Bacillus sp. YC2]MBY8911559.1 flagellin [Bacillus sp. YC2]
MRINHNIAALNTSRQLNAGSNAASKNMEKLSSGLRINRAGDDAAGLAISEKMRSQIRGLDMASKNAQDGISLIQTSEGALNETHSILQRMSELATQAANDTNTDSDRSELQKEMDQLASEVTRISTDTEFNTKKLLDGSAKDLTFQIGANEGQTMTLSINKMDSESLKVGTAYTVQADGTLQSADGKSTATWADEEKDPTSGEVTKAAGYYDTNGKLVGSEKLQEGDKLSKGIDISSSAKAASSALTTIKTAIDTVSSERAKLGAVQNRLEHTINNLGTSSENLTSAESRIRDVDMASEMMEYTKNNILTQASQAMLAQANQQPQQVLQLLKG